MQSVDGDSIQNINPETVLRTSLDTTDQSGSLSTMSTEYSLIINSIWADLFQNVPFSDCRQCKLNVLKHNSSGFSSKLELVCKTLQICLYL